MDMKVWQAGGDKCGNARFGYLVSYVSPSGDIGQDEEEETQGRKVTILCSIGYFQRFHAENHLKRLKLKFVNLTEYQKKYPEMEVRVLPDSIVGSRVGHASELNGLVLGK